MRLVAVILTFMATVISIVSQKGGTGKSSTAINLACALHASKKRIMVIDTDPQATFTLWHRKRRKANLPMFDVQFVPKGLLEEEVEQLRTNSELDIILMDCPGNIEDITATAVKLSDAVVSPIRPSSIDMEHAVGTARFIEEMRKAFPDILFLLFINQAMTGWNLSRHIAEVVREVLQKLPKTTVLETQIPMAVAIAEFFGTGMSIYEYAPKSKAASQYKKLTKEIIECLQAQS